MNDVAETPMVEKKRSRQPYQDAEKQLKQVTHLMLWSSNSHAW
jgi:hypothetical protein